MVYKTPYLISQHVDTKESVDYDVVEGEVDLLPIQSYFFDQININRYSHSFIVKSEFNLDINMLQEAFDILTNYHDMLRVIYRFDGDDVIQEVLPVNTRVCDIKEHYIEDNFEETMKKLFLDSLGSINMENKMMDIHLIHYCDETYVSFVLHHLIVDGVSWNILLMDLSYIYYKLYFGEEIKLSRPYPYKYWVEDVKKLVYNISDEEKQHWIEINNLLDDSQIKGAGNIFAINMEINYDIDNLLMLSEEEYLALAISRAYKKTYGKDIIFSRESHGRDDTIANLNRTIGWFTSEYPVPVEVCNGNDNVSLMRDVYSIKNSFNNVNNLGLNYGSLIYITNELEFKHCPVTFNFLSKEFVFKNKLFESVNQYLLAGNKIDTDRFEHESYGITFNILRLGDYYFIDGNYANNTYIGDEFDAFIENIRYELEFIADYEFDDGIVCCLSEPQMGIYLDEKVNEKENAYLTSGIIKCGKNTSIDEIKGAINKLINKHPLLKSRILDTGDMPLLICDSDPLIKVSDTDDYSKLIRPFDLDKSLARFFIINNEEGNSIYYNIHHLISDAITCGIIEDDLAHALNDDLDDNIDLAFIRASYDSFESKFGPEYESAHEFFKDMFSDIDFSKADKKINELEDKINELTDGVEQLLDGSSKLYNGLATLADKSGDLIAGVKKLADGSKQLSDGASSLADGSKELDKGMKNLFNGISKLDKGTGKLEKGAKKLYKGVKSLNSGVKTLDKGAAGLDDGAESLQGGISQLYEGLSQLSGNSGSLQSGAKKVFESLLSTADKQLAAALYALVGGVQHAKPRG